MVSAAALKVSVRIQFVFMIALLGLVDFRNAIQ
jgi:hypothetical protein